MTVTKRIQLMSGAKNYFISTWKTDNTSSGSSNNNQVKLPLESGGTYSFAVDWGDGSSNYITAYNQAEVTHTYASIGTYTIKIWGTTCRGWMFNNTGDRLKILDIQRWGDLELGNSNSYFYGCANLLISATDILKNPTMTTLVNAFRECTALTSIPPFNTSSILLMTSMFANDTNLNCDLSWMNTALVSNMATMLYIATNFNRDISNWSLKLVSNMTNILYGTAFDRTNYDLFLIGAHAQALSTGIQSGVSFRCPAQYTLGGAAETAKTYLVNIKTWSITDGGGV